ncbi:MAG: hydroxymethylglutaryl-CoA reductase, degradative [Bacillota bacterium]|nr:hydroxymethylglutaryl-CoA reductase, degradative [Bacillota bacterium]
MKTKSSRFPQFYKKTMEERLSLLADFANLTQEEVAALSSQGALTLEQADKMVENAIGIYSLPLGLGLNFLINGHDYVIPMAVEEPSIIAAVSSIAKLVREAGGFYSESTERRMIGQIQIVNVPDCEQAKANILKHQSLLVEQANAAHPSLKKRGGGALEINVRILNQEPGASFPPMLVVHLIVDTQEAMGANMVNTMVEAIASKVAELTSGEVHLRILSNFVDECLATAHIVLPPNLLATDTLSGEEVRDRLISAYQFAHSDIYRAVTHNKGVMNGIDAAVIASGNDWRAVEAAAHAYAARDGHYGSMTQWTIDEDGNLCGMLTLPMPVGTVGGSIKVHPIAKLTQKITGIQSARELSQLIVTVGLAQNFGAMKALVTDGIQKGHMALQARSLAMVVGATGGLIDIIASELVASGEINSSKAAEIMKEYKKV